MKFVNELKSRREKLELILKEKGLDAAVLAGNGAIGTLALGSLRYFTDWRCYFSLQAMVQVPGKEPVMCVGSVLHEQGLNQRGYYDVRCNAPVIINVIKELKANGSKKIGCCLDVFPADWYLAMKKEIPGVEFVDIAQEIFELRTVISDEVLDRVRRSAQIADKGFDVVCKMIKPGVKMKDIHTELDKTMLMEGAEEVFTLMSCGRFSYTDNKLECLSRYSYPDDRIVRDGDNVAMEITPKFKGYWTQLVRTVCVGNANPDLAEAQIKQVELINEAAKSLKPGVTLGSVLTSLLEKTESMGYVPSMPFGHVLGLDLDEAGRASSMSPLILKENMTVVLHPTMCKPGSTDSIFHGDSFIVTPNGGERITKSTADIVVL